jgi:CO dehydrogenase maturation factor
MRVIAVSGKGGTGKTTLAVLIMRWLHDNRSKSILAVDADPASNLGDMLGLAPGETVGAIREEMRSGAEGLPGGMTKQQFLEYKIRTGLAESPDFDLIAMGRPEGPGCYCYANNLLRDIMDTLGRDYAYVVIDNEAGMEHISRRTTRDIDHLFIVSNPTVTAVKTAGKISKLAEELAVAITGKHLLMNRVRGHLPEQVKAAIREGRLEEFCSLPEDDMLSSLDQAGEPIWPAAAECKAYGVLAPVLDQLMPRIQG